MIRQGHRLVTVPMLRATRINHRSPQINGLISAYLYNAGSYLAPVLPDTMNQNPATINGTYLWQETDNELGSGIYTAGDSSGYTDCGNDASLQTVSGGLTICAWVRLYQNDGSSGYGGVICKGDLNGAASAATYSMYIHASHLYYNDRSGSSTTDQLTGAATLDYQGTYHFAATWQPSVRASIFVNGIRDATTTTSVPATLNNPNYNVLIGAGQGGANKAYYQFRGVIHEARIYNRALSEDEIWQLWNPPTRWDLYRSPIRFFGKAAPAAPTGRVFGPAVQTF